MRRRVLAQTESQSATEDAALLFDQKVEEIVSALTRAITNARRSSGLSQEQLSVAGGTKQPVIARLETGETDPRLSTIVKILLPLGLKPALVPLSTMRRNSR